MLKLVLKDLEFIAKCKNLDKKRPLHIAKCALAPSFLCSFIYRLSHQAHKLRIPILPRLLWWVKYLIFKVDLDHRAKIYGGLYMPHPMGIVVGDGVNTQGNVKLMQGCTLGGNLNQTADFGDVTIKQPHLLANSFIGINSQVLGPLIFDEPIFVAPNATITKPLKPGLLFGANKQKCLSAAQAQELS